MKKMFFKLYLDLSNDRLDRYGFIENLITVIKYF